MLLRNLFKSWKFYYFLLWIVENIYPEEQTKKPQLIPAVWTRIIALSTYVQALRAENKNNAENYKERINNTTQQFMVDFFQQSLGFSRHMVTGTSDSDPINKDTQADASPTNSSSTVPSYRLSVNRNSLRCLEDRNLKGLLFYMKYSKLSITEYSNMKHSR